MANGFIPSQRGPHIPVEIPEGMTTAAIRFNQTVGRVVTAWDYLNNREQLIYADTGVRSLPVPATSPLNGIGTITISRYNNEITLVLDNVEYVGTNTSEYLTAAGFIPVGFRPGYSENPAGIITNNNANATYPIGVLQGSRLRRLGPALTGAEPGLGTSAMRGTLKWKTIDLWPSTLPGTAVGSIPA